MEQPVTPAAPAAAPAAIPMEALLAITQALKLSNTGNRMEILLPSFSSESHLERLGEVCQRFRSVQLKLRPEKCQLFQREVHYLGHVVSQHGIATDPAKISAVKDWKTLRCTQEVKSFLGFVGYYRRFCPDFATIARPLNILSSKETKFQ